MHNDASFLSGAFPSTSIPSSRQDVLRRTAEVLLEARRTNLPIADLPADLQPASENEAFFVQDVMMEAYGAIGGWKIGARGPDAVPFFAPMPRAWIAEGGSLYKGASRLFGVEAEIAFLIGTDLPARETPYTREDVLAAIASCHAAIEILESAYVDPLSVARENMFADMQMHGGFVHGPAFEGWRMQNWADERVALIVDGSVRKERQASNPAGTDLVRLLLFLANEGAARTGGLRAGQWVTTGSWTGADWTHASADIQVQFAHAGDVGITFSTSER